jgi:hypothetical protein
VQAIFYPPRQQGAASWFKPADCVWQAPQWLTVKICLSHLTVYDSLQNFFCNALIVRNYRWQDAIAELVHMKIQRSRDSNTANAIYEHLCRDFRHEGSFDALRYVHSWGFALPSVSADQ